METAFSVTFQLFTTREVQWIVHSEDEIEAVREFQKLEIDNSQNFERRESFLDSESSHGPPGLALLQAYRALLRDAQR